MTHKTPAPPCPRCRGDAELIHPMGEWVSREVGYGPDGSRIVCRAADCRIMSPAFYGPTQDADALAWWVKSPARVTELLEANNREVERRRSLARTLRQVREEARPSEERPHGGPCACGECNQWCAFEHIDRLVEEALNG